MTDNDNPDIARLPARLARIVCDPDAPRCAYECGWIPGSGLCRNRACSPECLFRQQRETEANRIEHGRRQRRREQRAAVERMKRLN